MNELEIIKKFLLGLTDRCSHYHECGCACSNVCGMAKYCSHAFRLSEEDINELYKIYSKNENEYLEELELAKKIKKYGIDLSKLEGLIELVK